MSFEDEVDTIVTAGVRAGQNNGIARFEEASENLKQLLSDLAKFAEAWAAFVNEHPEIFADTRRTNRLARWSERVMTNAVYSQTLRYMVTRERGRVFHRLRAARKV